MEQMQCFATLSPQNVTSRQFDNSASHQVIRCSANISKERFTHPVFDISFGLTPLTGIFIVRGKKQCLPDHKVCWSDFKIPSQALRELLLQSDDEENAITAGGDSSGRVTHATSVIGYTCNIADSSRNNSMAVRCAKSGTIRFVKGK